MSERYKGMTKRLSKGGIGVVIGSLIMLILFLLQ